MEDYCIDIITGKGPGAKSLRLPLPPFTLIGATTHAGLLAAPLRDRFGVISRLEYYNEQELLQIIHRSAKIFSIALEEDGAVEISKRSRGTPRISNRLLKRLRDFAEVKGNGVITKTIVEDGLSMLGVDAHGLDDIDRKVLLVIMEKYNGGPVGPENIAASISESINTIEDICEPYLMQIGLLQRTPRGRMATLAAYDYFGLTPPASRFPTAGKRRKNRIPMQRKRERSREFVFMNLLLHCCCGPCAVGSLPQIQAAGYEPYCWFFNPNIHPYQEHKARRQAFCALMEQENLPFAAEKRLSPRRLAACCFRQPCGALRLLLPQPAYGRGGESG